MLIARSTIFLSGDPCWGQLVPPLAVEASRWFVEDGSRRGKLLLGVMNRKWFRSLVAVAERLTVPGIILHYAVRKRCLEDITRRSLAEGFHQIIVLGAGFDTLALRLHKDFPKALCIEIDHPATQKAKRCVLEQRGFSASNLVLVPFDLILSGWETCITSLPGYRSDANPLFIAEGLLMYLTAEQVTAIFRSIRQCSTDKLRFAFTFMETCVGGRVDFKNGTILERLWLRMRGEPFQWGVHRDQLPAFLESHGFSLRELVSTETFRQRYLGNSNDAHVPLAEGELVCVAETN